MIYLAIVLVMLFATPALAQAPLPVPALTMTLGPSTPTGQTVVLTWTQSPTAGVTSYGVDGGIGTNNFATTTPASPYTRIMPYPAVAGSMWACVWPIVGGVNTRQSQRCSSVALATGPMTPPTSQIVHVTANEPTTNANGTPLTDLAKLRIYWSISPGGFSGSQDFPASKPTGGGVLNGEFTVPTNQGVLTGAMTAIDLTGTESTRSTAVTFTLGGVVTPPPPPPPPTASTAPTAAARCQRRIKAVAPDATGGWMGQLMDGTTKLSTAAAAPLQRDVTLENGVHNLTVVWTKTGVPARTSAVTTVTCQ